MFKIKNGKMCSTANTNKDGSLYIVFNSSMNSPKSILGETVIMWTVALYNCLFINGKKDGNSCRTFVSERIELVLFEVCLFLFSKRTI